ncbi:MAG: hypothetical protein ACPLW8_00665 [Candidatus Bathyarchaeales archaeon]
MEGDVEKRITYFRYCGEVNTEKVLQKAKLRCEETGINKVVIASETGRSALKALTVFKGTKIKLIVVTHYPATIWGPKGDIPIGLKRKEYARTLKKLEENGVKIVQGTRPFAPPTLEGIMPFKRRFEKYDNCKRRNSRLRRHGF